MSRFIEDKDGDHLQVIAEQEGDLHGVTLAATQRDAFDEEETIHHATVGPVDPRALIEAIKAECELHEDDEVHDSQAAPFSTREAARLLRYAEDARADGEKIPVDPEALQKLVRAVFPALDDEVHSSPVVEAAAEQINSGKATLSFEEAVGRRSSGTYVHTTPATAEEPRVWAGADEPIIDSLIGRVADLEDEKERTEAHGHLAEHWNRRLEVVRSALGMLPAPGKRGGLAAAFAGEETPDPRRVENALKIARFAADEDRDIPGVDS